MQGFFAYRNDGSGNISGYEWNAHMLPKNNIEALEKTLQHLSAFFEIEPRLTKDSVIISMHDADISRATTGEEILSSYIWEGLKQFNLVDREEIVLPTIFFLLKKP